MKYLSANPARRNLDLCVNIKTFIHDDIWHFTIFKEGSSKQKTT